MFLCKVHAGVILVSIPKCGTHLLAKLLYNLGYTFKPIGGKNPFEWNSNNVRALKSNEYTQFHAITSPRHINDSKNHKVIFIYRDPRDQVLSLANYIKKKHPNLWTVADLNLENLISTLIDSYNVLYSTKVPSNWNHPIVKNLGNIRDFYSLFWDWTSQDNVYVASFEKLIGKRGGGDDLIQFKEIENICHFLSLDFEEARIKKIAKNLFGGTLTFHKGIIGTWKNVLTHDQQNQLKHILGDYLIELGYEHSEDWC